MRRLRVHLVRDLELSGICRFAVGFCAVLASVQAQPQGINLDLDIFDGDPQIGNGAPSPQFGGAANQPGYWNRVHAGTPGPEQLLDLSGNPSSVVFRASGGIGTGIGFRFEGNTGDYALLLNDAAEVGYGGTNYYTLHGLVPGLYRVITYAVKPQGGYAVTYVTVPGSSSPNPQAVTGPMPGNALSYLVTHSIHEVNVTSGRLMIEASIGPTNSWVNGMQLVLVPEPAGLVLIGAPLFYVLTRRSATVALMESRK